MVVVGGGGQVTPIVWHESSSWVKIRLHTESGLVWLCRRKSDGQFRFVVVVLWFLRKIRPIQLCVEFGWVRQQRNLYKSKMIALKC